MTHITSLLERPWTLLSTSVSTAVVDFVENHIIVESGFYIDCFDYTWHPVFIKDMSLILCEIFDSILRFCLNWALKYPFSVMTANANVVLDVKEGSMNGPSLRHKHRTSDCILEFPGDPEIHVHNGCFWFCNDFSALSAIRTIEYSSLIRWVEQDKNLAKDWAWITCVGVSYS